MKLHEIEANSDLEKFFRQVVLHFASVAPTKFKPRDGGKSVRGLESGDYQYADGKYHGKHIEIYVPQHDKDFHMVTVMAHGGEDFIDSVEKKIDEWPNVIHGPAKSGRTSNTIGADLGAAE